MMSHANLTRGVKGATRQSWKASSPRDLLVGLVDGNAGKSKDELLPLFEEEVRKRDEFVSTIIEYWFTNNYRSLMSLKDSDTHAAYRVERKREVKQEAAVLEKAVSSVIRAKARLMLLDLMMPNGKRLRACTGEECRKLSKSTGRWLAAVSREVPSNKKVGESLTEDRLHELYEAAG